MDTKRKLWADVVRIVAIYLVLVVHNTKLETPINLFTLITALSFAIAKTCVPLLVMLSGALLLNKNEGSFSFYKKRASRYLLPWIFWSVITAVILFVKNDTNTHIGFLHYFKEAFFSFWFLPMLTCLYLITPIIRKLLRALNRADLLFLIVLWFLTVSLVPFTINSPAFPLFIDNSLLTQTFRYFGYYILGYFLIKNTPTKVNFRLLFICLIFGIGSIILPALNKPIENPYFDYHSPGIILESLCGFVLIKQFVRKYLTSLNDRSVKIVTTLSQASFGIYLIHLILKYFLLDDLGFTFFANQKFPQNYINSLILFLIAFVIISKLKRIRFIGNLVG